MTYQLALSLNKTFLSFGLGCFQSSTIWSQLRNLASAYTFQSRLGETELDQIGPIESQHSSLRDIENIKYLIVKS